MSRQLDILFVKPSDRKQAYQSLSIPLAALEPPVWAGLLASYARGKGLSVSILDPEAEGLGPQAVAERVAQEDPVLVVVVVYGHQPSASTQNMPAASSVTSAIKAREPERRVLLVGGHVAALPERTLREERADFVCGGEGFRTVEILAEALKSGSGPEKAPDLYYLDGDTVRHTPPAPLVRELDGEVPGVPWELLPMAKYRAHNWHCFGDLKREPYAALYTTLGCPYHCDFCCIHAAFKSGERALGMDDHRNSYRLWSPERVLGWLDILVRRYGVRNIKISDEMFVLNPAHVDGLCDGIAARAYDLNIWAYARVDTVNRARAEKLKRAGVNWLAFGVEAASECVRKDVQKRFDQETIFKAVETVRAAGISVIANFIFGLPEDDLASMRKTLDLAFELNCEFSNFYSAMAYPGSHLYRRAVEQGWPLPKSWGGYSQHARDAMPLPTKHLTSAEVLAFRDRAFKAYYTSPRYLDMIRKKFGPKTVEHIREMTRMDIQRETPGGERLPAA
jgi:radical SAM superfamily enzyme YgiQ (UPF0313 family)